MKYVLLGITVLLCLLATLCPAQGSSGVGVPAGVVIGGAASIDLPATYFNKISTISVVQNRILQARTTKYLQRLARMEDKLYRKLYAVDTIKAEALFAGSRRQYEVYLEQVNQLSTVGAKFSSRDYISNIDSLQTSIAFFNKQPSLLMRVRWKPEVLLLLC